MKKILTPAILILTLLGLTSCKISDEDVNRVVEKIPVANYIVGVNKTKTEGLVDTYTISYFDGRTYEFIVTNGKDANNGETGIQGIQGIQGETGPQGIQGLPGKDGHSPVVTIDENNCWVIDGVPTNFQVRGEKGETGSKGDEGLSAYEIFIKNNPESTLTEDEWLNSLLNNEFIPTTTHKISFVTNCDEIVPDQQIEHGEKIKKPAKLNKNGYTFKHWKYNNLVWNFNGYPVSEDMKLEAVWEANTYKANLIIDSVHEETKQFDVIYNEEFILPKLSKPDYIFLGWELDGKPVESGIWNYLEDKTFIAKWAQSTYTIHYDLGYQGLKDSQVCEYNKPFTLTTPTREGYEFVNWTFEDGVAITNGIYNYLTDLNLKANWKANEYTIYLYAGNGTLDESELFTVTYDQKFKLPIPTSPIPFVGWYYFETQITDEFGNSLVPYSYAKDLDLTAKYSLTIRTREDLEMLANVTDYIEVSLENDIDLGGKEWTPIGNDASPFLGSLHGNGHVIKNMTITKEQPVIGLFGTVYYFSDGQPQFDNIIFDNAQINVNYTTKESDLNYVGILGGNFSGVNINNVKVNSNSKIRVKDFTDESAFSIYTGGILGKGTSCNIADTINEGNIESDENSAGIVGNMITRTTLSNCVNSGTIESKHNASGITGYVYDTCNLLNCVNNGNINGNHAAGILNDSNTAPDTQNIAKNCVNNGTISSNVKANDTTSMVAGIANIVEQEFVFTNCRNNGNVSGYTAAGFVNTIYSSMVMATFNSCMSVGNVTGIDSAAGFVSIVYPNAIAPMYTNCFIGGEIRSESSASGFIGLNLEQRDYVGMSHCVVACDIYSNSSVTITAENDSGIYECYYCCNVHCNDPFYEPKEYEGTALTLDQLELKIKDPEFGWLNSYDVSKMDLANKIYPTLIN